MTTLAQMVWDCRAIGGMDKLVLMGWAEQVPDGSDLAYASKETVAESIDIDIRTIQRHTKSLVNRGCLIDTGGQKQCKNGWTPVYQVNLELLVGQPVSLTGVSDRQGCQDDRQGSRSLGLSGVRFNASFDSLSSSSGGATGVPPAAPKTVGKAEDLTENLKTETLKPTPTATSRLCPKCGVPWSRYRGHECQTVKPMVKPPMEDGDWEPMGYGKDEGRGVGSKTIKDGASQKSVESIVEEGKPKPVEATPLPNPPIAPAPLYLCMLCEKEPVRSPTSDYCAGCWNNGNPIGKIPVGAIPKFLDEIRPTGISS